MTLGITRFGYMEKLTSQLSVNAQYNRKRVDIELIFSVCRCSDHVPVTDSRRRGEAGQTWARRS